MCCRRSPTTSEPFCNKRSLHEEARGAASCWVVGPAGGGTRDCEVKSDVIFQEQEQIAPALAERGQALVEYALILGVVTLLALASLQSLGLSVITLLDEIATAVGDALLEGAPDASQPAAPRRQDRRGA